MPKGGVQLNSLTTLCVRSIGWLFVVGGLAVFAIPLMTPWQQFGDRLRLVEFPLGNVSNVAETEALQIAVGLLNYGRVQVYSATGQFLCGFFVDAAGGTFALYPAAENLIEVRTERNQGRFFYNTACRAVDSGPLLDTAGREKRKRQGRYKAREALFRTQIVRRASSGQTAVALQSSQATVVLSKPFTSWLIMAAGAAVLWATKRRTSTKGTDGREA
jgi:hypothetical protein